MIPTKPLTPDKIGYVVKSPIMDEWYDSIFENDEKMSGSTTFNAKFLCYLLPPKRTFSEDLF